MSNLEYPPSKFSGFPTTGGVDGRRADWGNPWVAEVLDQEVLKALAGCGHNWEVFRNSAEFRAWITDYCHERLFCGICASSEANERSSMWLEVFRAFNEAVKPPVAGFEVVLTMPAELSSLIADRADRRAILGALFQAVHLTMRAVGLLAWVAVLHTVSSEHPDKALVHFTVFYPGVTADFKLIRGRLDREGFAGRRRGFLDAWNRYLMAVCKRFGLPQLRCENIHLAYSRMLDDLACRLRYEMRPPLQDAFIHSRVSAEGLRVALSLSLSLLYAPGGVQGFRRIRPGGAFGPRAITKLFADLGYKRVDKSENGEGWVSLGSARLVADLGEACDFRLSNTGEVVRVARANVSLSGHGCPFRWERAPG